MREAGFHGVGPVLGNLVLALGSKRAPSVTAGDQAGLSARHRYDDGPCSGRTDHDLEQPSIGDNGDAVATLVVDALEAVQDGVPRGTDHLPCRGRRQVGHQQHGAEQHGRQNPTLARANSA